MTIHLIEICETCGQLFRGEHECSGAQSVDPDVTIMRQLIETQSRIDGALRLIHSYGQIGGDHHKAWVIDQVVRQLTREGYAAWIAAYKHTEGEEDFYTWDEGIAP